jgi:hypothetical protein
MNKIKIKLEQNKEKLKEYHKKYYQNQKKYFKSHLITFFLIYLLL